MKYYVAEEAQPLRAAFEEEVLSWDQVDVRTMFGCPSYIVDGRLFAFLVTDGVVITQLRQRDRETLAEDFELAPFQAGERTIERWIEVELPDPDALGRILPYVRKSYDAVLAMAGLPKPRNELTG